MNNLISWNQISPWFIHNISCYKHCRYITFKVDFLICNMYMYNIKGDFKTKDCPISNIYNSDFLLRLFLVSLILYRNVFELQMDLWIPPFKWNISKPYIITIQTILSALFWDTLYRNTPIYKMGLTIWFCLFQCIPIPCFTSPHHILHTYKIHKL